MRTLLWLWFVFLCALFYKYTFSWYMWLNVTQRMAKACWTLIFINAHDKKVISMQVCNWTCTKCTWSQTCDWTHTAFVLHTQLSKAAETIHRSQLYPNSWVLVEFDGWWISWSRLNSHWIYCNQFWWKWLTDFWWSADSDDPWIFARRFIATSRSWSNILRYLKI